MSETHNGSGVALVSSKTFELIRAAFGRRKRRFSAYLFWLVAYGVTVWFYVGDAGLHLGQTLPFLVPVAVVIIQMIYPTLFGWAIIVVPSLVYTVNGAYYLIRNITEKQWAYDRQGLLLGLVFVIAYVGVCIALFFSRSQIESGVIPPGQAP